MRGAHSTLPTACGPLLHSASLGHRHVYFGARTSSNPTPPDLRALAWSRGLAAEGLVVVPRWPPAPPAPAHACM